MLRSGTGIAVLLFLGLMLAGCGSSDTGSLFSKSPLDLFSNSSKATVDTAAQGQGQAAPAVDPNIDCPEVAIRTGAATLLIGDQPGGGKPNPLNVRYQGSIVRTARECHVNGNVMTMKVGIEGRIITGPAGVPGSVEVPLRIAVVQEGPNPKTILSKFEPQTVSVTNPVDRVTFTQIDPDITFQIPYPSALIDDYVVYVGFDPYGAPPKRKPVHRHRTRHIKPRSS
jgi:hypothetical protein